MMSPRRAAAYVNEHYGHIISKEMEEFHNNNVSEDYENQIKLFSNRFSTSQREAQLIIRYINKR